jgi:hypothetical protein
MGLVAVDTDAGQLSKPVIVHRSFREQGIRCRDIGARFSEKCPVCGAELLMCSLYGGICRSNKCREERRRLS